MQNQSSIKDSAVDFLQMAAAGNVREAFGRYVGAGFRHHNPHFSAGADALMQAMEENARLNPNKVLEVQRALQDGDLVAVHSRVRQKAADLGGAVVHIFRFEHGLIAELWDVGMAQPQESPNMDGMF